MTAPDPTPYLEEEANAMLDGTPEYRATANDVDEHWCANEQIAAEANAMAADGWRLVSFSVSRFVSSDGRPLRGATVFCAYVRPAKLSRLLVAAGAERVNDV